MPAQKSFGGVCILLVSYSNYVHRSSSIVHPATLTTSSVSSFSVLDAIVSDIVEGTFHGFLKDDPYRKPLRILLDCIGFIAGFREASDGLDVLNHSIIAGCNPCSFRRYTGTASNTSLYSYTTRVHSKASPACRTGQRYNVPRNCKLPRQERNFLGLFQIMNRTGNNQPLLKLHQILRNSDAYLNIFKTHLDAFRCSVVVPDHVLVGYICNMFGFFQNLELH